MDIKQLCKDAHKNAKAHGFWDDWEYVYDLNDKKEEACLTNMLISKSLMLIVGEVAEAQEGLRHDDMDNFREELADVAIRLFDLCGGLDINLEVEIEKKMAANKDREYLHGKAF